MTELESKINDMLVRNYKMLVYHTNTVRFAKVYGFTAKQVRESRAMVKELEARIDSLSAACLVSPQLTDMAWDAAKEGRRAGDVYWSETLRARAEAMA